MEIYAVGAVVVIVVGALLTIALYALRAQSARREAVEATAAARVSEAAAVGRAAVAAAQLVAAVEDGERLKTKIAAFQAGRKDLYAFLAARGIPGAGPRLDALFDRLHEDDHEGGQGAGPDAGPDPDVVRDPDPGPPSVTRPDTVSGR